MSPLSFRSHLPFRTGGIVPVVGNGRALESTPHVQVLSLESSINSGGGGALKPETATMIFHVPERSDIFCCAVACAAIRLKTITYIFFIMIELKNLESLQIYGIGMGFIQKTDTGRMQCPRLLGYNRFSGFVIKESFLRQVSEGKMLCYLCGEC